MELANGRLGSHDMNNTRDFKDKQTWIYALYIDIAFPRC